MIVAGSWSMPRLCLQVPIAPCTPQDGRTLSDYNIQKADVIFHVTSFIGTQTPRSPRCTWCFACAVATVRYPAAARTALLIKQGEPLASLGFY